jgi:hypothetical protein
VAGVVNNALSVWQRATGEGPWRAGPRAVLDGFGVLVGAGQTLAGSVLLLAGAAAERLAQLARRAQGH